MINEMVILTPDTTKNKLIVINTAIVALSFAVIGLIYAWNNDKK